LIGRPGALELPAQDDDVAAGRGERVDGRMVHDRDADAVRAGRPQDEPGDDAVDRRLEGGVQASPVARREPGDRGPADPVLPRDRKDRRHDARRGGNAPDVEGAADGDHRERREGRDEHTETRATRPTESPARRPDAAQGDQQGRVVHQEGLRHRPAALETDLLAGVDSLRLTDRAKRPPQRRAALHRDLEPGRGNADRGAPAHGGLPVEIVRGEDRRHGYAMPTSIPRNVESASPVAASLWGACTTPARSSAPASLTVSQAKGGLPKWACATVKARRRVWNTG